MIEFAEAVSYAVWKMEMATCTKVFLWLPTGFGKSICFELLPFVFDFKLGRVDTESSSVIVVSSLVSLMVDQAGMKITVGHRLKSAYIARLAAHFAQRSVLLAGQEMRMRFRQSNYHHV